MRLLGKLRGDAMLFASDQPIGRAEYELDGYLMRPGSIVASGEMRMTMLLLKEAAAHRSLQLRTDDGQTLLLRISGKPSGGAVHIDIYEGLPAERDWQR